MKLNIFDYTDVAHETPISLDDVNGLYVAVISGDEVITAIMNNGQTITMDACEFSGKNRKLNFFDGEYGVYKDDLEEWMKREDAYFWFGKLMDSRL